MTNQQKFVEQLKKRKESALKEQKNFAQIAEKAAEEYKDKKAQQDEFGKTSADATAAAVPFGFTVPQRIELITLKSALLKYRKDLADLQLKDKQQEVSLTDDEVFVESVHLEVLQEQQCGIKSSIVVTCEQIDAASQELEKKKQAFSSLKAKYNDEITKIRKIREEESERLKTLSERYSIPLGNELNTFSLEPKKTVDLYRGFTEVAALNTHVQLLNERETYFVALIALEQEKINYVEDMAMVKETYHKIALRKFASEDVIDQEIKKYLERRTANEALLKSYKAKKEELEGALAKIQNEVLENLKKRKADIQQQKDDLFKGRMSHYAACLSYLDKAEEDLTLQMDVIGSIGKTYGEIVNVLDKIIGHSKFIFSELESITIWYRPEYAITWKGIANIGADIKMFLIDVKNYFVHFDVKYFVVQFKDLFKKPLALLLSLCLIAAIFSGLLLVRRYGIFIVVLLHHLSERCHWFVRCVLQVVALGLGFVSQHAIGMAVWIVGFIFIGHHTVSDPYLGILFYLLSIAYLLYLSFRFFSYLPVFNERYGYCLMNRDSAWRFTMVLAFLVNVTIVLMCFRQAFMLAQFSKSELPTILLAINVILFQISLLCLITKEQVLSLIPTYTDMGERIYKLIDRHYYILALAIAGIIIMSNPYIGYGRLVMYITLGLLYSLVLIKVLHWSHSMIKQVASSTFFITQDDVVRERFAYAKTWFGVVIICSFLFFMLIGILVGAKIWGLPITVSDVMRWFNQPLLGIGKGGSNPLTLITLATIMLFIVAGFVLSFVFNRFVLEKIFDLMLVDSGVQSAITNLTRYLFVAVAILLGLQSTGYGGLITYMYVLILGIGYLIQNPLNDLVAYFIILMQRPIKIGDYIQIDENVMGVVRKITPKSVTLRKKNSTTIVVPNAQIINKAIVNWNYSRNFTAFNDIMLIVSYNEDPSKVKDLLLAAIDAHPNILKNPKPVIRLENFRDNGFEFLVRGYLSSDYTMQQWEIASDVRLSIVKILRENNIEIAVPMPVIVTPIRNGSKEKELLG
ncbi:MAG: mechanosensitive ion channel [Candidatus Dependentiae bacterium]|nr:mechanosensitive ion channel [Candidatus Dependentiae bacterium]